MKKILSVLKMPQPAAPQPQPQPEPQPAAPSKSLTAEQFAELEKLFKSDDRTGFYMKYYEFTGVDQALEQAQISSFSDFIGGIAEQANKLVEDHPNYPKDTADEKGVIIFSKKIKDATFEAVKKSYLTNGGGILTDLQIVQVAQKEWADLGMKGYFPGNAEVVLEKLMDSGKAGKTAADKTVWEKVDDAVGGISDMFSNLFSRGTAAGIGGMARQITKNPMEMFSSSALNTMLKAEGYTRHVTPDLRAVYFTDTTGKTVYVSAPNVHSFTNSQGKTSYLFTDRVKNINEVAHLFNVPVENIEEFDHRALGTIYADDSRGKTFVITPTNDNKKPIFALQEVKDALKSLGINMESKAACEAPSAKENSCKVELTYTQGAESDSQAYEVKKGDTVWGIAKEHGKTVNDILNTPGNEFLKDARHDNGNRIFPGEKIHVAHSNSRGSDSRDLGDKDHSWGKGDNPFAAAERALGHSLETENRNIEKIQQASSHSTGRDYGGWEGGRSSGGSSAEKSHSSGSHSSGSHSSGRDSSRGSSGGGSQRDSSRDSLGIYGFGS
jgi:LysM repeat protein